MTDPSRLMPPHDDGPPPMAWPEYAARASSALNDRLATAEKEADLQEFLERHPALVPDAFPSMAGHGGWPGAVIAQPPFKGFGHRVPDFMWISRHTGAVEPVLVEIEDPRKPWLSEPDDPRPSYQLTQALNQFRQWREWLEQNTDTFFKTFAIPPEWQRRHFHPRYVLVYGRRIEAPEDIAKLRVQLERDADVKVMTYDHLTPLPRQAGYLTLRCNGAGRYETVTVPATARMTPDHPDWWQIIGGRTEAVLANEWISDDRKEFLVEYLARCDEWAATYDERHIEVFGWRPGDHAGGPA